MNSPLTLAYVVDSIKNILSKSAPGKVRLSEVVSELRSCAPFMESIRNEDIKEVVQSGFDELAKHGVFQVVYEPSHSCGGAIGDWCYSLEEFNEHMENEDYGNVCPHCDQYIDDNVTPVKRYLFNRERFEQYILRESATPLSRGVEEVVSPAAQTALVRSYCIECVACGTEQRIFGYGMTCKCKKPLNAEFLDIIDYAKECEEGSLEQRWMMHFFDEIALLLDLCADAEEAETSGVNTSRFANLLSGIQTFHHEYPDVPVVTVSGGPVSFLKFWWSAVRATQLFPCTQFSFFGGGVIEAASLGVCGTDVIRIPLMASAEIVIRRGVWAV